ncbi:MAG: phosphoenolpyruvate synthase [Proteobacteria bacterium]|nr:phosphoenolpyruvate synthase [Pseudomonadota bacterium]
MNLFRKKYSNFKIILESNSELLKILSDIEDKLCGRQVFGMAYIRSQTARIMFHITRMVKSFEGLSGRKYQYLIKVLNQIHQQIEHDLELKSSPNNSAYVLPYSQITHIMVDFVGGKNANLGELKSCLNLPVPNGFAVTTNAFDTFIESNHLMDEIRKEKLEIQPDNPESILAASEKIRHLFLSAVVPMTIEQDILGAFRKHIYPGETENARTALRSSAVGEDSEFSFAGQYLSVLNVPYDKIIDEYKRVLASLFAPAAITYRLQMGILFEKAKMSVACLEMISSKAGGVMYTRHPFDPLSQNQVIINAVWGIGTYAVEGVITPDSYTLSKDTRPVLLESKIASKPVQLVTSPAGYLVENPVPEDMQTRPCLTVDQAVMLCQYGMQIEEHFKTPQDIEWALDPNDSIVILQTRPLRLEYQNNNHQKVIPVPSGYPLLLDGGDVACPGVGFGEAYIVRSESDLLTFPDGGVLVAAHSSPQYVMVMRKAKAIVTNSGSISGHMATLAREFKVPAVLNTHAATTTLKPGMLITVDANSGRVYSGKVPELIDLETQDRAFMKDSPVFHTLQKIAGQIVPLNLVNPKSSRFTPENCKTIHDVMRLLHEFSYLEIFKLGDFTTDQGRISVKLDAALPIDLYIIDLGGGLGNRPEKRFRVKTDQIISQPLKALLEGMSNEARQNTGPRPVNLGGFFSVMSEQMFSPPVGAERFGDRSYAIISDKYMNFSSRVGYHYSVLDAYCGQTANKNYINFQFKGGAADKVRRNRRARLIGLILDTLGFLVDVQGDMTTVRFSKRECSVIYEKIEYLGRLLIFTRQMDMLMESEATVNQLAESFLKNDAHPYKNHPQPTL